MLRGLALLLAAGGLIVEALSPSIAADSVEGAEVTLGERIFQFNWALPEEWEGPESLGKAGDGLGPMFNDVSCVACHNQGGSGGAGDNDRNAHLLSVEPAGPVTRSNRAAVLRRLRSVHPELEASTTIVLQKFGLGSAADPLEYDLWRHDLLSHSLVPITGDRVTPVSFEIKGDQYELAQRNTPALWGAGLIDQLARGPGADPRRRQMELQHQRTPWITGRIPRTASSEEGWFGWRGQTATLHQFVLNACAHELGLEVPTLQQPSSPLMDARERKRDQAQERLDLTDDQCRALTAFVRQLPRPRQMLPRDGESIAMVHAGELLFGRVGCADCHVKQLATLDGVYSDFLLHDMGTELEDRATSLPEVIPGERVFDIRGGYSGGSPIRETPPRTLACDCEREWRTAPLWGVADSAPYMHDGRASTLMEAIRCHDGEAATSRHDFLALSADEQNQVLAFLESLRAPEPTAAISFAP